MIILLYIYIGKNDILDIVDTLLTEYHNFVTQWEDCEVGFIYIIY